jgi:hypothetical protein
MTNTGVWGCAQTHRDTHFYKGDCPLVIKWFLNRVEEDVSGLTFQEWTSDVDTSRPPVTTWDCEVWRVWVLTSLFCQWMMI